VIESPITRLSRTGLQFSVGIFHEFLKEGAFGKRIRQVTAAF
jgi:hypothetical protein